MGLHFMGLVAVVEASVLLFIHVHLSIFILHSCALTCLWIEMSRSDVKEPFAVFSVNLFYCHST